jgi:hypothetical protein
LAAQVELMIAALQCTSWLYNWYSFRGDVTLASSNRYYVRNRWNIMSMCLVLSTYCRIEDVQSVDVLHLRERLLPFLFCSLMFSDTVHVTLCDMILGAMVPPKTTQSS